MKKVLFILIVSVILLTTGCSGKGDVETDNGTATDIEEMEEAPDQKEEEDTQSPDKEVSLLEIFPKGEGTTFIYEGALEYGHILVLEDSVKDQEGRTVLKMKGYMYDGLGPIGVKGELRDFHMEYVISEDAIIERIPNKGKDGPPLDTMIPNKIILKKPLKIGTSWEEDFDYKGQTYTGISTIIANTYNPWQKEEGEKGYVVETIVEGMEHYKEQPYKETRVIDIGKGIVEVDMNQITYNKEEDTYFEYPLGYRLYGIEEELPSQFKAILGTYMGVEPGKVEVPQTRKEMEALLANQETIQEASWSPQEPIVTFIRDIGGHDLRLYIWKAGWASAKLIHDVEGNLYDLSWSPDGSYISLGKGTSISASTAIIAMEDIYNKQWLNSIGSVIWSPDSDKLLIGQENDKKRVEDTELSGTIDLAVYDVASQKIEVLLEADNKTDYLPSYWHEDNTIGYRKVDVTTREEESLSIEYKE